MKRISFLFSVASIAAVSFLSSCKKDDTVDPVPAPTITASFPNNTSSSITAPVGTPVVISYNASAAEGIDEINITTSYGTTTNGKVEGFPKKSSFKSSTADDATITNFSSPSNEIVTITFTIKDKKGQTTTSMLYLNKPFALSELTGGIYFNIWGGNKSAFDFDSKMNVSSTEASGDIISAETAGNVAPFLGTFKAANGASMTKSTFEVYNTATAASLENAFKTSAAADVAIPKVGDVYIVKYSSNMYAAMKITKITDDGMGAGTTLKNSDSVEFVYKK